jgi:hypothetical protein
MITRKMKSTAMVIFIAIAGEGLTTIKDIETNRHADDILL